MCKLSCASVFLDDLSAWKMLLLRVMARRLGIWRSAGREARAKEKGRNCVGDGLQSNVQVKLPRPFKVVASERRFVTFTACESMPSTMSFRSTRGDYNARTGHIFRSHSSPQQPMGSARAELRSNFPPGPFPAEASKVCWMSPAVSTLGRRRHVRECVIQTLGDSECREIHPDRLKMPSCDHMSYRKASIDDSE